MILLDIPAGAVVHFRLACLDRQSTVHNHEMTDIIKDAMCYMYLSPTPSPAGDLASATV
jgi:hypothetical protein